MSVEMKSLLELGIDVTTADPSPLYRPMTWDAIQASARLSLLLGYWSSLVIEEGGREMPSVPKRSRKGFAKWLRKNGCPQQYVAEMSKLQDQLASMNSCAALSVARFLIVADMSRPVYLLHRDYHLWSAHETIPLHVNLEKFSSLVRVLDSFSEINR